MKSRLCYEGLKLVRAAEKVGAVVRLFGGVAVELLVPLPIVSREAARDIDCVTLSTDLPPLLEVFESLGYREDVALRRLYGRRRRRFDSLEGGWKVDLCLDALLFSGTIDVSRRLDARRETLAVADLLLSKLQPKERTRKDAIDVTNILWAFRPGEHEGDSEFCLRWFLDPCRRDWGLYQLVAAGLEDVATTIASEAGSEAEAVEQGRLKLVHGLRTCRKSFKWKMRAMIGPRLQYWNDVASEDGRLEGLDT